MDQNDTKDADDVKAASAAANDDSDVKGTGSDSGLDYIDELPKLIDGMQKNYVDVYVQAMQTYTRLMERIAQLKTVVANSTKDLGNGQWLKIDKTAIEKEINDILADFGRMQNALFVSQGTGDAGYAECQKWITEFGLDPTKIVIKTDGTTGKCFFGVDLSPIISMRDALTKNLNGNNDITINMWQANMAGFDANVQSCNTGTNKCAEKYSSANENLNSLMKMISNILAELQRILAQMLS